MHRLLLVSGDKNLISRVKQALDTAATVMSADPAVDNVEEVASQFRPEGVLVDSDVRMGARTAFERLSAIREWFPGLPMIVIGNASGAQLILTAMRAGAQDFIDRDASDEDIRSTATRYAGTASRNSTSTSRMLAVLSGGANEEEGDFAVNLGVAIAVARPQDGVLLVDLTLPASNAAVSLGVDLSFRVREAVTEMSRLDRALLDLALARCPRSGLYVLPLAVHGDLENWSVSIHDLRALLEVCRSLYDVVIVSCGPFSRQEELLGLPGASSLFFLPCNQRFTSIKGAAEMLRLLRSIRPGEEEPVLVIHEFAPGLAPDAAGIRNAIGIDRAIELPARWRQMAESINSAEPLALAPSSPYAQQLSRCLQDLNLVPRTEMEEARPLKLWARKLLGVLP